jgi:hypothetical protein
MTHMTFTGMDKRAKMLQIADGETNRRTLCYGFEPNSSFEKPARK